MRESLGVLCLGIPNFLWWWNFSSISLVDWKWTKRDSQQVCREFLDYSQPRFEVLILWLNLKENLWFNMFWIKLQCWLNSLCKGYKVGFTFIQNKHQWVQFGLGCPGGGLQLETPVVGFLACPYRGFLFVPVSLSHHDDKDCWKLAFPCCLYVLLQDKIGSLSITVKVKTKYEV